MGRYSRRVGKMDVAVAACLQALDCRTRATRASSP
jgi:hypothetical protein